MIIGKKTITCEYKNIYSLQGLKIGIPIFQRFYDWKPQQIVQLKNDILENLEYPEQQLYLLDFIYYEEEGIIKIADGQQRLVTLNNLIKAIKDVARDKGIEIENIELFEISYDILANDKKYNTHFSNYPTSPFKTVYLEMKAFIEHNIGKINNIINVIKNKIFVYFKKCSSADDAFVIFQQINTGGKPLSKDEVIKTALDQFSEIYEISLDTSKIKGVRQSLISYYKMEKNDSSKNFDNMEIISFLRDFVTKNKATFQNFVDTISLLSKQHENPIFSVINYINRSTLFDVLNILSMKKINTMVNKEYQSKLMLPLCLMSVVLTLNGGSPTTFRYLLNDVLLKIKQNENVDQINLFLINTINSEPLTWKINLKDFSNELGSIETAKGIKKALLIMDVIDKNVSGNVNVELINLEHIYPQNPTHEWAANGWPSHHNEQRVLIDNIGNYLLLCESVNKSIQNQYISHKIIKYDAIIKKDKILQTPLNTVDFAKFENDRDKYIYERQSSLAEKIQKELPLGKVLITN